MPPMVATSPSRPPARRSGSASTGRGNAWATPSSPVSSISTQCSPAQTPNQLHQPGCSVCWCNLTLGSGRAQDQKQNWPFALCYEGLAHTCSRTAWVRSCCLSTALHFSFAIFYCLPLGLSCQVYATPALPTVNDHAAAALQGTCPSDTARTCATSEEPPPANSSLPPANAISN